MAYEAPKPELPEEDDDDIETRSPRFVPLHMLQQGYRGMRGRDYEDPYGSGRKSKQTPANKPGVRNWVRRSLGI